MSLHYVAVMFDPITAAATKTIKYTQPLEGVHQLMIPDGAPKYKPALWNTTYRRQNCLAYALRLAGHGSYNPGQLLWSKSEGVLTTEFNVESMHTLMLMNDFEEVSRGDVFDPKSHVIVARLRPSKEGVFEDFHFYSVDDDGLLSSKMPGTEVTRTNLENIHRAHPDYSEHIGFF